MQFKMANSNLRKTQDKKKIRKFYQHNACKDYKRKYILFAGIMV